MQLFYYMDGNLSLTYNQGQRIVSLSGEEGAHLRVLRLKPGDKIHLTDGRGNLCKGNVLEAGSKTNAIELTDLQTSVKDTGKIHIAVAPPKNIARFEWFLEKATEIGINEITPFFSEHSERIKLRTDRLNKILISAMKQSLRTYLPVLNEPLSLESFLQKTPSSKNESEITENRFIAWLDKESEQKHLVQVCPSNTPVVVLIGPEGDFSHNEVSLAKSVGYITVSLGQSRLRTETAALAACLTVKLINEIK